MRERIAVALVLSGLFACAVGCNKEAGSLETDIPYLCENLNIINAPHAQVPARDPRPSSRSRRTISSACRRCTGFVTGLSRDAKQSSTRYEHSCWNAVWSCAEAGEAEGCRGWTPYGGTLKSQMDDPEAAKKGMARAPQPPVISDTPPSLITELREQFGLKLETGKLPVDVIVVDSVSKLSPN